MLIAIQWKIVIKDNSYEMGGGGEFTGDNKECILVFMVIQVAYEKVKSYYF